jgi:uncharacterized protein
MGLQDNIKGELKVAMKARETERVGAIRIIIGEFGRQSTKDLSDDQVIAIIKKLIKSEKELLASSGKESSGYLSVLEGYLPKQASEEEIRKWIVGNIDFAAFKNKMHAMRPIMAHFGPAADGNMVKEILQNM